jgi:NNP family nitrate/nitrite transporter-like MFS transporter
VYTLIAVAFLSVSVFLGKSLVMEASLEVTLTLSTLLVTFLLYGRSTGYLSFVYYLTFGGFLALGLWIPTVFTYIFKTSLLESGIVLFFSVISAALFRPVGGMVGDRTGGKSASLIGLSFIVFGSLLTFVGLVEKSLLLSIISFVFLGSAFSFSNGAVFKLVSEVYTKDKIGVASGVIGGIGGFGGFSLSTGIGIVGSINISYVTLMFLPLSLIGIVLLLMMRGEGGVNAKEELREELQGKGWRRGGESR